MDLQWHDVDSQARFSAYVEQLSGCLGHADRIEPFRSYCTGLLLPGDRKSVEPMAARLKPEGTSAHHQSLLHFVGQAPWDEKALLRAVREAVLPVMTADEPIAAWIIDDTSFPKKGTHSVGVARQYCGQLGKQDNCQVAVSLSVATTSLSLPVGWQLYLPEAWVDDAARRQKAKVPDRVRFKTKPQIALAQIRQALTDGIVPGVVLADAGYGNASALRDGIDQLGLEFIVGISANTTVWPQGMVPSVREPQGGKPGRRRKNLRRGGDDAPVQQVAKLAEDLPAETWQTVTWREAVDKDLTSRFAAFRVRPAQGDQRRSEPRPEHWLLVEWPEDETAPTRFWFSNLSADTPLDRLVYLAKLRWLIERDYLELKQELGLGHYEGRGWTGFHHHGALCIAAYGFLVAEQAAIPPSGAKTAERLVEAPEIPEGFKPRGSPDPDRTARAPLNRHTAPTHRQGPDKKPATMSLLHANNAATGKSHIFMTQ
jgi:SRSO17 transposase